LVKHPVKFLSGMIITLLFLSSCAINSSLEVNQQENTQTKQVEITILHIMDGSHPSALQAVTDAMTLKNANLLFNIQQTSTVQYADLLKTKLTSGKAPDIIFGKVSEYTDIVRAGQIVDLTNQPFINRLTMEVRNMMTVDGKVYGIAEDVFTLGVFYNKDMFQKYNLQVPRTYTEYIHVMETFQANQITPFVRSYNEQQWIRLEFLSEWRMIAAKKYPNFFTDIQSGATKISDYPEFKDAMTRFAQRLSYRSGEERKIYADQALQAFAEGTSPMIILHSGNLSDIRKKNPEGNFGFFASPVSDDPQENQIFESPDSAFMITSQSKHQTEALALFDFMLSPEGWSIWSEHVSTIPAMKDAVSESKEPMLEDILNYQYQGKVTGDVFLFTGEAKKLEFEMFQQFALNPEVNLDEFIAEWEKKFSVLNSK